MRTLSADDLRRIGIELFTACGAPADEAAIVAEELVEASLMGLDSHGVMRYVWYVEEALGGKIKPGAPVRIVQETPSTAIVDGGFNFGPVSARRMVEIVCEKAEQVDLACVVSQNSHHVGRLGAYVQKVAERGLFGLATANSSKHGHYVVPWGGREGRLATNPLAYAAPTRGRPVVMDMSTSMIPEGKIRHLMHQGKPVPPGCIQDAEGNPTIDPHRFYGPPHGTIMPFGSELGYKGFGLGLLVEILSGLLAGMSTPVDYPYVNGLWIMAVNPVAFCGTERFAGLMEELSAYMTTTPPAPGYQEVVMPGTLEFRTREQRLAEGIPVAEETWQQIVAVAERLGGNARAIVSLLPPAPSDQ
jgi:uncharacterized oxidoreductase